ncbi:MAG: HPr(Ser) kinase/phosphatase [Gemmatimonadales bacterium]|jgi:HPr kinase/phosphorylase|nr:MAG: HPr(Ser) kinase/phosphatase [Gemmatimonadales bacterium]
MASSPGPQGALTVRDLLETKRETLRLELLTPDVALDGVVEEEDISSPGLALSGYTRRVPDGRMQVFGETEITYLQTLSEDEREVRLRALFAFRCPAVFVTKGLPVPPDFVAAARDAGIPVFRSHVSTKEFFRRIKPFLERSLSPTTTLHGSLADVYGVGLLFVGQSGVGKSECVLDLVERGHRLVADDVVLVTRRGNEVLIGQGHELQRHHMEIRGIGIIDIRALFGIRAIRQQKRIEVVVHLEHWDDQRHYNRTGLESESDEILGVHIPRVTIPLNPGKNITVISEVVAMNHLLRYAGVDSAQAFNDRLKASMRPIREYLEEDYE